MWMVVFFIIDVLYLIADCTDVFIPSPPTGLSYNNEWGRNETPPTESSGTPIANYFDKYNTVYNFADIPAIYIADMNTINWGSMLYFHISAQ